jgi:DNA-directed RNA polymerase subunit RPC12/RpoP
MSELRCFTCDRQVYKPTNSKAYNDWVLLCHGCGSIALTIGGGCSSGYFDRYPDNDCSYFHTEGIWTRLIIDLKNEGLCSQCGKKHDA